MQYFLEKVNVIEFNCVYIFTVRPLGSQNISNIDEFVEFKKCVKS